MNFFKISKFFLYLIPFSAVIVSPETLFPFIVGKYVFFRTATGLALIFFLLAWLKGEPLINNADKKMIDAVDKGNKEKINTNDINKGNKVDTATAKRKNKSAAFPTIVGKAALFGANQCLSRCLRRQPLVIAVSAFTLVFLLAGFLGYNPAASFWSNFERGEGGLQILFLFIFFALLVLLFRDKKDWHRLFKISLFAGVLVILYGVFAALGVRGFMGGDFCLRFAGSLGNAAYTGTYLIFMCFYAAYLAVVGKKNTTRAFLIGLILVFLVFLFLTQTRGAFLGLGTAVIAGLGYLVFKLPAGRLRLALLILTLVLIVSGSLVVAFRSSINLMPFCPAGTPGANTQIFNINFSAESFQTRLALWKKSIEVFKEKPILGWGPENFAPAFEKHFDPRLSAAWYDRAHNIFFDYLVMTGILGLLSFIGIFVVYYWQLFMRNSKFQAPNLKQIPNSKFKIQNIITNALFFSLPIAYLVQGLVLFDVLPIYINLFLFLAFAVYKFKGDGLGSQLG